MLYFVRTGRHHELELHVFIMTPLFLLPPFKQGPDHIASVRDNDGN